MNDTTPPFAQLIGQTEKTLNAILDRLLDGTVSEAQWVALVLIAGTGGTADRDEFTSRVAQALKADRQTAAYHVGQLAAKGLVLASPEEGSAIAHTEAGSSVTLTEAGQQLVGRVRKQVGDVTGRLWGDLPRSDLDVAGRVLSTVLERAEADLASRP
jgi:DNA-binding MarR family transcriptional regulator